MVKKIRLLFFNPIRIPTIPASIAAIAQKSLPPVPGLVNYTHSTREHEILANRNRNRKQKWSKYG